MVNVGIIIHIVYIYIALYMYVLYIPYKDAMFFFAREHDLT